MVAMALAHYCERQLETLRVDMHYEQVSRKKAVMISLLAACRHPLREMVL